MPQVELPPNPTSPGQARRFVAEALCDTAVDVSLAVLLVSELVTNAVLHARTALVVTVSTSGTGARVGVRDQSSRRPRVRYYDRGAATGRGLHLLESLASRWGVDVDGAGKTVWFELTTGGERGAATAASVPARRAPGRRRLTRAPGLRRGRGPSARWEQRLP